MNYVFAGLAVAILTSCMGAMLVIRKPSDASVERQRWLSRGTLHFRLYGSLVAGAVVWTVFSGQMEPWFSVASLTGLAVGVYAMLWLQGQTRARQLSA